MPLVFFVISSCFPILPQLKEEIKESAEILGQIENALEVGEMDEEDFNVEISAFQRCASLEIWRKPPAVNMNVAETKSEKTRGKLPKKGRPFTIFNKGPWL